MYGATLAEPESLRLQRKSAIVERCTADNPICLCFRKDAAYVMRKPMWESRVMESAKSTRLVIRKARKVPTLKFLVGACERMGRKLQEAYQTASLGSRSANCKTESTTQGVSSPFLWPNSDKYVVWPSLLKAHSPHGSAITDIGISCCTGLLRLYYRVVQPMVLASHPLLEHLKRIATL